MDFLRDKNFLYFVAKFIVIFCTLYLGTLAVIGFAAPGGYHSPFVEEHLDYISWLKRSLIFGTKTILGFFGFTTETEPGFIIRISRGRGVYIAMSCVGYGVYSFWTAYVLANRAAWLKKIIWVTAGLLLLWILNVSRISLLLVAINKGWPMPFNIDHHTWFNIFAYIAIFTMIWAFEKSLKKTANHKNES